VILVNGTIFTARDKAHKYLLENYAEQIKGGIIYHCGPLVKTINDNMNKRDNNNYIIISAGPTTSSRMNQFTPAIIEKYGIKAIIGKGGMDSKVLDSIKGRGVYLSAIGGLGALYAKLMKVKCVEKLEFGMPEAIWELEVKDFPVIVTMDAKENSIYDSVQQASKKRFLKLIGAKFQGI